MSGLLVHKMTTLLGMCNIYYVYSGTGLTAVHVHVPGQLGSQPIHLTVEFLRIDTRWE